MFDLLVSDTNVPGRNLKSKLEQHSINHLLSLEVDLFNNNAPSTYSLSYFLHHCLSIRVFSSFD